MRSFRSFTWKDTNLRIASDQFACITHAIVQERTALERYIRKHPEFRVALTPLPLLDDAPISAQRMAAAAWRTGLGPMASVAGALAQIGAEAAMSKGASEAIVENGGDIYLHSSTPVTIGVYAGNNAIGDKLAFLISPAELPLALCSSSSIMGHSLSFGSCDLATVIAGDAALADAVATLVCNLVQANSDLEKSLNKAGTIPGVQGILAVKDDQVSIYGKIPELTRNRDSCLQNKMTKDLASGFFP
ncbi:MAG: ApbE family lipoprotein [Desulfobulbus propionicus]|nr:MAG: ApbE family lipoprotein [Desulfobulbus propionicus]